MASRDELKLLIDQMPEEKLDLVRGNLESILHPPARNPKVEEIMRRSAEFQGQLPDRLKKLQAGNPPGSIAGFFGGGAFGSGPPPMKGNGQHSYSWQEGKAIVTHTMRLHEDVEVDLVERLQLTEDDKTLVYEQEIYAEGLAVMRREEFPVVSR